MSSEQLINHSKKLISYRKTLEKAVRGLLDKPLISITDIINESNL